MDDSKSISNTEIRDMFAKVLTEVQSIKCDISNSIDGLETLQGNREAKVQLLESAQESLKKEVSTANEEIKSCKSKMSQMADVIDRQGQMINELKDAMENMEKDKFRNNLFIKGLDYDEDENCTDVVKDFFKTRMKITETIELRKANRVGKSKTMFVQLVNVKDKSKIYSHVKNLQGQKNLKDKYFSIED